MTTYQGRWGHHPCNYEGYLKLRRLYRAYWEGRRLIAKWNRWRAKRPQNRTRPEPIVPAVYREVCASPIVAEFQAARHGVPTPDAVLPLRIAVEQVNQWLHLLDEHAVLH
jgi:hypothetical protein